MVEGMASSSIASAAANTGPVKDPLREASEAGWSSFTDPGESLYFAFPEHVCYTQLVKLVRK
jgi:hypothetical protein